MTTDRFPAVDPARPYGPRAAVNVPPVPELVRHLTMALSGHAKRLNKGGFAVPREVEELTAFLTYIASMRQEPPFAAETGEPGHYVHVPDPLLVTKAEAAERLGVSVRTIERLAAAGRLPQVHVERSARFRVKDLQFYVDHLEESPDRDSEQTDGVPTQPNSGSANGDHADGTMTT
jgi:excisionase family DNA binding protein